MSAQPIPQPRRAVSRRVPPPTVIPDLNLTALGAPMFAIVVTGEPAPQGSKAYKGHRNGKPILVESSKAVAPWRERVCAEALRVLPAGWVAMDGPLVMDLILTMPRPLSHPKTRRTLPHTYPDLSKLMRSTEDALATDTKKHGRAVIADDARIVATRRLAKVYARDVLDPDALREPGAVIRLWPYPAALLGKVTV